MTTKALILTICAILPASLCFALAASGPASAPTPASKPALGEKAAALVREFKQDASSFSLYLTFKGDSDKPYYSLYLSVPEFKLAHGTAFDTAVVITKAQAEAIIDHLGQCGFFDAAVKEQPKSTGYLLSINAGKQTLNQDLGFGLKTLQALDGLRAVLTDPDAAGQMDTLLTRLSGHRKQWEAELPPTAPLKASSTAPADPKAVAELVGRLGDDNYKVREEATRKLVEMGDAALPLLKARLEDKALDPETANRIKRVLETSKPAVAKYIDDLSSADGKVRVAATKGLFVLGKNALKPLEKAGAKQVTPKGGTGRRIDIVYSLLAGLVQGKEAGYRTDAFLLQVEKNCTVEEVAKIGAGCGFTIRANNGVIDGFCAGFPARRDFAAVLKAALSDEKVVSVELMYFSGPTP